MPHENDDYIALLRKRVAAQDTSQLPKHLLRRRSLRGPEQEPPAEESPGIDFSKLAEDPEMQQTLAYHVQYTPSKWLLEQEAGLIADRRDLHHPDHPMPRFRHRDANEDIYEWARKSRLTGLCFSGGGIRSATFNLGILQGLAVKGWLDQVDYLSSVSGGGYIHSWLLAWLKRETAEPENHDAAEPELAGWRHVMSRLVPLPHHQPGQPFQAVWPRQIQWLRRYSNYLTPHKGALTGDTWSAVASWIRNVSVNQGLLISIFLAVLCVPHLFAPHVHLQPYRANGATSSSVVSSVTAGGARTTLTLDLGPARPPQVVDDLAATPGESFAEVFRRYARWDAIDYGINMAPWGMAALVFFVLASGSVGRLLRLEYSGALSGKDDELPERRGDSLRARFRRQQIFWANALIVAPMLCFGLCITYACLSHPATPAFTFKLFCLLVGLVWTETFSGGAISETVRQEQERRQVCSPQQRVAAQLLVEGKVDSVAGFAGGARRRGRRAGGDGHRGRGGVRLDAGDCPLAPARLLNLGASGVGNVALLLVAAADHGAGFGHDRQKLSRLVGRVAGQNTGLHPARRYRLDLSLRVRAAGAWRNQPRVAVGLDQVAGDSYLGRDHPGRRPGRQERQNQRRPGRRQRSLGMDCRHRALRVHRRARHLAGVGVGVGKAADSIADLPPGRVRRLGRAHPVLRSLRVVAGLPARYQRVLHAQLLPQPFNPLLPGRFQQEQKSQPDHRI